MNGSDAGASDAGFTNLQSLGVTLLRAIGRGASSTVYTAKQPRYDRDVAVKIFATPIDDEKAKRRFERECKTLGRLSAHPNVVSLYGSGFDDEQRPFIVMDLCPRGTLQETIMRDGPMSVAAVLRIGVKISSALDFGHSSGVLHRDVKPANILMSQFEEPQLSDFGISTDTSNAMSWTVGESLTPLYAAPEVLEHGGGSVASDIWSLASTLYALLLGRAPYADTASSLMSLMNRIVHDPVPPLERDDVPEPMLTLLSQGMSKAPEQRPPTARLFGMELQSIQALLGHPVTEYFTARAVPVDSAVFVESVAEPELSSASPTLDPTADFPAAADPAREGQISTMPHSETVPAETIRREAVGALSVADIQPTASPPSTPSSGAIGSAPGAESVAGETRRRNDSRLPPTDVGPSTANGRPDRYPSLDRSSSASSARPSRRWLVAVAVVIILGGTGTAVALSTSSGRASSTSGHLPISGGLPTIKLASECTGFHCRITDLDPLPSGASLHVDFGDGIVKTASLVSSGVAGAELTHRYTHAGRFSLSGWLVKGRSRGPVWSTEVSLFSIMRRVTVHRAPSGNTLVVKVLTRSTPCRSGIIRVERRTTRRWRSPGAATLGKGGLVRVGGLEAGTYRVDIAPTFVANGICQSARSPWMTVHRPDRSQSSGRSIANTTTSANTGGSSGAGSTGGTSSGGSGSSPKVPPPASFASPPP